jgi:hypothetical protein
MLRGVVCLPHGFGHTAEGVRLSRASLVAGVSYNDLGDRIVLDVPSGNAGLNAQVVSVTSIDEVEAAMPSHA